MSKFNQYLDSLHRVMSDAEVTDVEQQSLPPGDAIEQIIVWLHEVRDARKKNIFIGEPMKKRIGTYGINLNSYETADLWDGRAMHETGYGWGH